MVSSAPRSELSDPAAHAEYYRGVLHELIEMGADIARAIHREVSALAVDETPTADVAVRFERVCRCVRRSILLARTLDAPPPVVRDGGLPAARRRVIRTVEDQIDQTYSGETAERLHAELVERLEGPEIDEDLASCPVEHVIIDICRDLGLEGAPGYHPWKRRTPADVTVLFARADGLKRGVTLEACGPFPGPFP